MKKFAVLLVTLIALVFPVVTAYAATTDGGVQINIQKPSGGVNPTADPGLVLSNIISIIFALATLMVLFMLILGAFNWITSGGEKENVAKARNRITHALIGLLILALAFFIVRIVGGLIHVNITSLNLPAIDQGTPQ